MRGRQGGDNHEVGRAVGKHVLRHDEDGTPPRLLMAAGGIEISQPDLATRGIGQLKGLFNQEKST